MNTVKLNGYNIIKDSLAQVETNKNTLINTISPNSYGLAVKDLEMREALKGSDYLVLDGLYFGLAPLLYKGKLIKRITGWDCFTFFSNYAEQKKGKVFFLGSTDKTLEKIKQNYKKDYPNVEVESYSPPFKPEFEDSDNDIMVNKINQFNPDILFVGLTAPKQEKWGYQHKSRLNANVTCTIGNVFDWYAGNTERPSAFWQKIGMEWLVRIFLRPEIFKRNIKNQLTFFWHVITFKFYKI